MLTVQQIISKLNEYWASQGCALHQGYDVEIGAGTFNPATFLRCLGPEPYRAAYVEPSRRPKDGRYGENPNRMQFFHQYQVILKPSPPDSQRLYLQSLEALGFRLKEHDIRFVHDDWEQPTLGAWGLGWEVWRDGMEVSQYTYFQAVGGLDLHPITVELTYGIERIAMTIQNVDQVWDLMWDDRLTYRDIFHRSEVEWSVYNFEEADTAFWRVQFDGYRHEASRLLQKDLPIPAYDFVMKASHAFNILDSRGVISVAERTGIIAEIRDLARRVALGYLEGRKRLGFPLLQRKWPDEKAQDVALAPLVEWKAGKDDFLFEIGSEELPASFVPSGMRSLEEELKKLLENERLTFDAIEIHGTPRRLAACVKGLGRERPREILERRGPPATLAYDEKGELTVAGQGFVRSFGGMTPELALKPYQGVEYLFGSIETPPESSGAILARLLPGLIERIEFPKKMRWGSSELTYARPIRWVAAMHGKELIPFSIGGIASGTKSSGHSQLCPGNVNLPDATSYVEVLRKHKVLVSVDARKDAILVQIGEIEEETGSQALSLPQLLAESVHLSEWPLLTSACFDSAFLKAPHEVLISEMVHHQRYFPLTGPGGELINRFVIVADNEPSDEIRRGNVKVLSARLSDGVFLYSQDLKSTLEQFNERLKGITFRKELGSLYNKAERITEYTKILHEALRIGDLPVATRAALLSKADLASELVNEFPELQGTVGKHYAIAHGEDKRVAAAIEEHWLPREGNGVLPATPEGTLVSVADKIDNLLSAFALGLKPSSSSDPYGLRRQVLGLVRMLVQGQHRLALTEVMKACYEQFLASTGLPRNPHLVDEIREFFFNRIKTVFLDFGFSKEEIAASLSAGFTDIYDAFCRVQALHRFHLDPRFASLCEVYKRVKGQFVGFESKAFFEEYLVEPQEKDLANALNGQEHEFEEAMHKYNYDQAFALLADLQPRLAALFDHVRVLAEDPKLRKNRIALLGIVFDRFGRLLDFSKLRL